ncbi:hypothetical protein EIP86_007334 [Pleurotus ostreatoroseus]|nr:hypothetical protein EIP86_007334 [Pleurotus ostreatoroseus]
MPEYPSPATPQSFVWDLDSADQTRGTVPQPQEPQEPQAISPLLLQQNQLLPSGPSTPQEQQLSVQPPLQHQPQHEPVQEPIQQPQQVAFDPPRVIQLHERAPSQYRFIDESPFVGTRGRGSHEAASRAGDDEMYTSTSPSSSGAAGPSRVPHGRAHTQNHPYRRPHSAAGPVGTASRTQAAAVRSASSTVSRRTSARVDDVMLERASQLRPGQGGVPTVMPAVGSGLAVACPAMSVWRVNLTERPAEQQQGQRVVSGGGYSVATNRYADPSYSPRLCLTQTPAQQTTELSTPQTYQETLPDTSEKRFSIRTDVHFDAANNMMTAMLELPGLKKGEIRILMNVCPFSGVRQLTISGRNRPSFPSGLYTVRERKFGAFFRTIPVPMQTKAEDVIAIMEDGILILKVPAGTPAPREEPREITIH